MSAANMPQACFELREGVTRGPRARAEAAAVGRAGVLPQVFPLNGVGWKNKKQTRLYVVEDVGGVLGEVWRAWCAGPGGGEQLLEYNAR